MTSTNGHKYGYVEESFSMCLDPNRVRVFTKTKYSRKTYNADTVNMLQDAKLGVWKDVHGKFVHIVKAEVYRVGSKNCPFKIDWRERFIDSTSKYNWRNLPFVSK